MADALYEAIALKVAQGLREHLLRDAPNHAHQSTGSYRTVLEAAQNQNCPLAPDQAEHVT